MKSMLTKNTLRDIRNSKARFLSIMLIIMIGVGFFAGIKSSNPSMRAVVNEYYADTRLMDFRLLSTVGFDDDDLDALSEIEGVTSVEGAYFADVFLGGDSGGKVVRLHTFPKGENCLNEPVVTAGRAPEKSDEAVVGASSIGSMDIGSEVYFTLSDSDISEVLKETEYTVVGQVESPLYISFDRGTTNIGDGSISAYILLPEESFSTERYTEVFVRTEASEIYEPYTEEYENAIEEMTSQFEAIGAERVEVFTEEYIVNAQSSIDEARLQFDNEKEKAFAELEKAREELDTAWEDYESGISDGEVQLEDAKSQITVGWTEIDNAKNELDTTIEDAETQLEDARQELESGRNQLEEGKAQLTDDFCAALEGLKVPQEDIDLMMQGKDMPSSSDVLYLKNLAIATADPLDKIIADVMNSKTKIEEYAQEYGLDLNDLPEYTEVSEKLEEYNSRMQSLLYLANEGSEQMLGAISEIEQSEEELLSAEEELRATEEELEEQKASAEEEISKGEEELNYAQSEYEQGVIDLENLKKDTKEQLEEAELTYAETYEAALQKFEDAEEKLLDAQAQIDSLPEPLWYVFDRSDNPGYSSYVENVERVDAVASVFPIFFLLVAVLVCVTTMSRLIEEKRGDIGALITLGYKKSDIVKKFLVYSTSATILGCIIGITVGSLVLPMVIFNAYGMLYSLPDIILKVDFTTAIIGTVAALLSTSAVTVVSCGSLLRQAPATLLRPKAPKPGKRIFLERIGFIWNKMNFTAKVTARNIFRYKARFMMTVIGVAGCTALILGSFGLHNSIGDIISLQFEEICTYDAVVVPKDEDGCVQKLCAEIDNDDRVSDYVLCRQVSVTAESDTAKAGSDIYLVVPEHLGAHAELVHLRERESQKPLEISDSGAIISEKLSKTLGVKVGDSVTVKEGNDTASFKISGICENYVSGYLYVSPKAYENAFGKESEGNMVLASFYDNSEQAQSEFGTEYLEKDYILGLNFMSNSTEQFNEMIKSLNLVIVAVLVCAAGLAFVVLYNLTNINIAERKREVSTLKVLGFNSGETSAYIYRENIILTVIGMAIGLVLGIYLNRFIVSTIEIDMVMFGREIHPLSFVLASAMTILFAALVNIIMHFRIKKIDMIESLKSVE